MVNSDALRPVAGEPRLVAHLRWGPGEVEVPLRDAAEPGVGSRYDTRPGRSLRPMPRMRAGPSGSLAILADESPWRFVFVDSESGAMVAAAAPDVGGSGDTTIVDFALGPDLGLYLLEVVWSETGDEPLNRVRHVDASGRELWRRSGLVDHRRTDPANLRGTYVSVQTVADGTVWVVPQATTAGLVSLEPRTGRTLGVKPLDADVAIPVLSPNGRAYYGRVLDPTTNEPRPQLAETDLRTDKTVLHDVGDVPLLNLAAANDSGRIYARTSDGITCVESDGTLLRQFRLAGAVVAFADNRIAVAAPPDVDGTFTVSEYRPGGLAHRWPLPLPQEMLSGDIVLVDVAEGPEFVLQVDGSPRDPGQLVYLDRHGHATPETLAGDGATAELARRESRTDPETFQVDREGAIYVPVSGPDGYSILRWASR